MDSIPISDGQRPGPHGLPAACPVSAAGYSISSKSGTFPDARFLRSSLQNRELVPKGEVLDGERPFGLKDGDQGAEHGEKYDAEPLEPSG